MSQTLVETGSIPQAPTITSFSPNSGTPGTVVTFHGTHLKYASSVTFKGLAATIVDDSTDVMKIVVPAGAGTCRIEVATPAGIAKTSRRFTVT
jgi:hypothetical protein